MKEQYDKTVIEQLILANVDKSNHEIANLYNVMLKTNHEVDNLRRIVRGVRELMDIPNPYTALNGNKKYQSAEDGNTMSKSHQSQVGDKHKIEEKGNELTEEITKHDFAVEPGVVTTIDDALKLSKVDMNVWEVDHHIWNSWTTSAINRETGKFQQINNVQVKLWFKRKNVLQNNQWQNFIKSLESYTPDYRAIDDIIKRQYDESLNSREHMLELSMPDLHIGKLAWDEESGENFDTKEAIRRYNKAIDRLLSQVNLHTVQKILLPIGNDMLNIDTKAFTTTAGTPQACDSRWQQMFRKAKDLLVFNIDRLAKIAPVEVLVVPGNHDNQTMFYLGDSLESWYRSSELVSVNNAPTQRKYVNYGVNLVGFTHGNEEKHADLPLIMASEQRDLWAKTMYREFHLGHFHKSKAMKFVDVDEFPGCKVRIIPSLSGSDAWHNAKGYMSMKSAEAFLYHKDDGLVANYKFHVLK